MLPTFARLHVLLAREAHVGLVIRHGTAKSVCTLLWDLRKDEFTLGQWMRGRIDIETCDLSPDGKHFLYSAQKYVNKTSQTQYWTVVSRTPYLKAIAYYPGGVQGGWFVNKRDYSIQCGEPHPDDRESEEVRRVESDPPAPSLYGARLVRAGWTIEDLRARFNGRLEFVRPAGDGWELRYEPRRGYRLSCGELVADTSGWDWAGMDDKRLVWTNKGCLWTGTVRKDGIQQIRLLYDFNGMQFQALAAPYEGGRPGR
ncbi:MAG TPA: hypothetical protein VGP62_29045 [Bryobacteraceae bacterium]|nr:hypothetical protein [Bryobacteraceae bacterium]